MDEERELARAFAAREAWAYDGAYRVHARVLYAAAFGILLDAQEAQDCVHDVMLRLWQRGSGYRAERGALRAFLAVSVRNEALSRLRKSRNRARIAARAAEPIREEADIGERVVQRESVKRAIETLDEKQRRSIELAYFDHLTHDEIAGALGEPIGTIKSRISSALRKLREIFKTEEPTHAGS